jgi:hypothetical protein
MENAKAMRRLAVFALTWWVAVAAEVGAVGAAPGLAVTTAHGFELTTLGIAVHFLCTVAISAGIALGYLAKPQPTRAMPLALFTIVLGLVLDAVLTVPLFVGDFGVYFGKWTVWAGYGLAFVMIAAVGKLRNDRSMLFATERGVR